MKNWKKIVVKIGTNVLTDEQGYLDIVQISQLVNQISILKSKGIHVLLVSSGAVGAGKALTSLTSPMNRLTQRQVFASIGQVELMRQYQLLFQQNNIQVAQVLSTKEDFRDRRHFINMQRCLNALIQDNLIPIMNENDVISITELMFTDNDELASLAATLIDADSLVILSSVDGIYQDIESKTVIKEIKAGNTLINEYITGEKSAFGRGGMLTKLSMCQRTAKMGIQCYIANGTRENILLSLSNNTAVCTYFPPSRKKSSIKKWIAYTGPSSKGGIQVNEGAEKILLEPAKIASILPVGLTAVYGNFRKGDVIEIKNQKSQLIGTGLTNYHAEDLKKIIGENRQKPVIHYNYLHIDA